MLTVKIHNAHGVVMYSEAFAVHADALAWMEERMADDEAAYSTMQQQPAQLRTYYRVIGYNSHGGVVTTEVATDEDTDRVHDRVMSLPGVRSAITMGPFEATI